jgi:hypothetical protein
LLSIDWGKTWLIFPDTAPHHYGKLDPDPHQSEKPDADPDPHQEVNSGSF